MLEMLPEKFSGTRKKEFSGSYGVEKRRGFSLHLLFLLWYLMNRLADFL
jgi:hypothetical protein